MAISGQRYETITSCELLEVSLVGVPGNADATVLNLNFDLNKDIPLLKKSTIMDLKKIAQALGLAETATEAEVLSFIENENERKVTQIVQLGMAKGVVLETNVEFYTNAVKKDPETWQLHFEQMGATPAATTPVVDAAPAATTPVVKADATPAMTLAQKIWANRPNSNGGNGGDRGSLLAMPNNRLNWTYEDYLTKDPDGLRELMEKDSNRYDELVSQAMQA